MAIGVRASHECILLERPIENLNRNPGSALVALDDALGTLARMDERKAKVVELRFFGGLSVEETAEVLKISTITVIRAWSTARAWLYRELKRGVPDGS